MQKSKLYAYIGTAISGVIILLILLFVYLPGFSIEGDDGVMISFGDSFTGGGYTDGAEEQSSSAQTPKADRQEEHLTQEDESVAIPDTPPKKKPDPKPSPEEERKKREEKLAQQADDLMGGMFGSSTTEGSGLDAGDEIAGNPVGSGSQGGHSWSLGGRNLLGTMPTPDYNINQEGYVTVRITVNSQGVVTSASIARFTISDQTLHDAAIKAAKRTQFSSGKGQSTGTITYNFKLR